MLVQINPDRSAQLVNFPRDSKIYIPGRGSRKITTALAFGGPELTARAIEQYSGLKIHYYMVTTFPGLQTLINDIGGVKIYADMSVHDPYSGADVDKGTQTLNGGQALAFARARHNTPNGDFTRADHQQDIVEAALIQEQKKRNSIEKMAKLMPLIMRQTETDLPARELFALIRSAMAVKPGKISKTVLQGSTGMSGGGSYVFIDDSSAKKKFKEMKAKE